MGDGSTNTDNDIEQGYTTQTS